VSAPRWRADADLIVVGSGVAGLTAAMEAQAAGLRVLVVTKAGADEGNTSWAQGGVAVVTGADAGDSTERHIQDTLAAGGGLCDEYAVRAILGDGLAAVNALRRRGAVFDLGADGRLARTREGGHRAFRVIHAGGDATGAEIERALLAAATAVPVLEHHVALLLLQTDDGAIAGLAVLATGAGSFAAGGSFAGADNFAGSASGGPAGAATGVVGELRAPAVLLATGGLGQLYLATTNPDVATGDGVALALAAGATAVDLEFVQFHPTVLYTGAGARGRRPLVTEAVRGEGAVLVDATGARVMTGVHPLGDLAPRDVVSAAITRRMAELGTDHVYLDATHLPAATFAARFPTVHAACAAVGVEPSTQPIPVAPAAHYACGGIASTVDGRTEVAGLYVAGEVARTGLHGANRLASNSLLEGLVVGGRVARAVAADLAQRRLAPADAPIRPVRGPVPRAKADRDSLQRAMSRHAGIGRDAAGLAAAIAAVDSSTTNRPVAVDGAALSFADGASTADRPAAARDVVDGAALAPAALGREDVEDAALTLTAGALLAAAQARAETRGCHVRIDHPATDNLAWRHGIGVRLDGNGRPAVVRPAAVEGAA